MRPVPAGDRAQDAPKDHGDRPHAPARRRLVGAARTARQARICALPRPMIRPLDQTIVEAAPRVDVGLRLRLAPQTSQRNEQHC